MNTFPRNTRPFSLLTGSTGLVGGLVLARLLTCDIPVAVLVRGNKQHSAQQRVELLMRQLEVRFRRRFVRPVVISGDLGSPQLGLSENDASWIAENCTSIVHSAANLLFRPASEHPHNEPFRTNLEGTRHLLNLARQCEIEEWHYVSTAYLAGMRIGTILESEGYVGQEFANDYECSKSKAEDLLRASDSIRSLTVYRPSIVIDTHPAASPKAEQSIATAFAMYQALSQRFGIPNRGEWTQLLGFTGDERKNIVMADWVSRMIAEIFRRPELHNTTYHLTNSRGLTASDLEDGFRAAAQVSGARYPVRQEGALMQLHEQAAPFVAAFQPYFRDDPKFDRTNTRLAMLACNESDCPELTVEMLRNFCVRHIKPKLPPKPIALKESPWQKFAKDHQQHSDGRSQANPDPEKTEGNVFGLMIVGPSGGQWLIEEVGNRIQMRESVADPAIVCWITSASTLERLLDKTTSIQSEIDSGRLLIEVNLETTTPPGPAADPFIPAQTVAFSRFLSTIRAFVPARIQQASEVVHVG